MSDETRESTTYEFAFQLDKLINYFTVEFDISVAQLVGVLEIAKLNVAMQSTQDDDDEDGEEECEECIDE